MVNFSGGCELALSWHRMQILDHDFGIGAECQNGQGAVGGVLLRHEHALDRRTSQLQTGANR